MREVIYRNLSSPDRHQRDLTLAEVREDQGITTQLEKRYTYRVKAIDPQEIPEGTVAEAAPPDLWELRSHPTKARQIFVRKHKASTDGSEEFTYKIIGSFYAMQGEQVFLIIYRHIIHLAVNNMS